MSLTMCTFKSSYAISCWQSFGTDSNGFQDLCIQIYQDHHFNLLESRDIIGQVSVLYPGATSYSCSIVTQSVSSTVLQILGSKHTNILAWRLSPSRSRDIIDHVTIWFATCHFLLVVQWNQMLSPTITEIFSPRNPCTHTDTHRMRRKRLYIQSHAICTRQKIKRYF